MADALVIAHVGGFSLWESTRDQYLKMSCSPYLKVVFAVVNNDLMSLVNARPLKFWKETLAILCTSVASQIQPSVPKDAYDENYQRSFSSYGRYAPPASYQPQSLSANIFVPTPTPHVSQNCSGSLNSVICRCDNRMYFARQGAAYQACFMRQGSREKRTVPQYTAPPKPSCTVMESSPNASKAPLFSRHEVMEPNFSNLAAIQPLGSDWRLSMPDPPMFARLNKSATEEMLLQSKKKTCCSRSNVCLLGSDGSSSCRWWAALRLFQVDAAEPKVPMEVLFDSLVRLLQDHFQCQIVKKARRYSQ